MCILDNGKALNISQLSSLIKDSSFVISNDTGPGHIASLANRKMVWILSRPDMIFSLNRYNYVSVVRFIYLYCQWHWDFENHIE